MLLSPGQRLGPYEILGPLGSGGMAEVHRARDPRLGRDVAVKVLPEGVASTPDRLARFEREARAVAGLNHPNIVVLHSIEDAEGIRFLTMELVDGEDLSAVVAPGGLPLPRLLELAIPLAEALGAAHERGVIHRDLKPANVMVTREGRIKVVDFGLARLSRAESSGTPNDWQVTRSASLTTEGAIMGTVPYMAPEQIRGEAVDARTDLFAFGVVLFELATGRRPFRGTNVADITSAILRDAPPTLASVRTDMPADLARLIERCLDKNVNTRLRTAREAADTLRGLQRAPERRAAARPEGGSIRSLVVLPLDNVARDGTQEYFVDGMTEALISDLSRLPGLRVISRTSAMRYKGVHKALAEIARELDVDAVLEGSALLLGSRVRISVSLVAARRDETLWSERYDRQLADVLDLQNEVAQKVAQEIALRLSTPEQQRLARRQSVHPEAHIELLKGQHIVEENSPQAVEMAMRHFHRALELDPQYAPAWEGLAHCHNIRAGRGMAAPLAATAEAMSAAQRAMELDPSLGGPHAEMGTSLSYRGEYARAQQEMERALELNPGRADSWATLGRIHYCNGRHAEAERCMLKAVSLDPLSMIHHTSVGDAYYYAREFAKSVTYYRRAIELDPRFDGAHTDLARSLEALGEFDESLRQYEEGRRLAGTVAGPSFGLAHLAAARGDKLEARRMLEALKAARATKVVSAWGIAALHACLGDADEAFHWLDTAVDERSSGLVFLRVHPRLDPIRSDPRYSALLQRLGVAQV